LEDFNEDREENKLGGWLLQDCGGTGLCPNSAIFSRIIATQTNNVHIWMTRMNLSRSLKTTQVGHVLIHYHKVNMSLVALFQDYSEVNAHKQQAAIRNILRREAIPF
jgi:hypothetical protein